MSKYRIFKIFFLVIGCTISITIAYIANVYKENESANAFYLPVGTIEDINIQYSGLFSNRTIIIKTDKKIFELPYYININDICIGDTVLYSYETFKYRVNR